MSESQFKEAIYYISDKLNELPDEKAIEQGLVELMVDHMPVILKKGRQEGSLQMLLTLGFLLQPIHDERLEDLAASNFLGVNTGGCSFCINKEEATIVLKCHTTAMSTPQENWEWLHRLLNVAVSWSDPMATWSEFVPLYTPRKSS